MPPLCTSVGPFDSSIKTIRKLKKLFSPTAALTDFLNRAGRQE